MRRTEHLGARALTAVGLAATLVYLVWRVGFSLHDTAWWLSIPALLVEIVSFLGAAVLTWALWPVPARQPAVRPGRGTPSTSGAIDAVDAVVRVSDDDNQHAVRATMLALRAVKHIDHVIVLDLSARPSIASLATEFQAVYAASDRDDRNGLRVLAMAVRAPQFLLLDAGDIPTGDIVERLVGDLADPKVAVVQGLGVSFAQDSAEHGPNGRHELLFERTALNPALGSRGAAVWLGTGSLVRVDALRDVLFDGEPALEAHWRAGLALQAAGWTLTAPGDVAVFAHHTVDSEGAVATDRLQRARAARRMVFGSHGVLRAGPYSLPQRLAVLAWSVRPLSGVRRIAFISLLCAALLAGEVPFHATGAVLALGWLPAFVYTSLGLSLLSGWTLRPGDRTRWSLHSMGVTVASLRGAPTHRSAQRPSIVAVPSPQYGAGLVVAVVAISTVLVLRGLSDRLTHTLHAMPQTALMALLVAGLWMLGLSLDLLRVLARRVQLRRTARVVSSIAATLGERAVSIVDLTAHGAGVVSQTGAMVQERMLLDSTISTRTGVTTMRVPCVVRNSTLLAGGDYRIGVEFGDLDDATANALAELCTIEPMWERLGVAPGRSVTDARPMIHVDEPETEASPGRVVVRMVSLLALVGAVASSAPATVDASPALTHHLAGTVVAVGAATDGAVVDTGPIESVVVSGTTPDATAATGSTPAGAAGDSVVPNSLVDIDEPVITDQPPIVESAPAGVPGAVVVGVCSLDAGPDGGWGTADDEYTSPVSTSTRDDGSYLLDLQGEACWVSVAPPVGYTGDDAVVAPQAVDVSGVNTRAARIVLQRAPTPAGRPSATGSIGDTVWSDQDGNGVQEAGESGVAGVTLSLLDADGRWIAGAISDAGGGFRFHHLPAGTYTVGAANLPAGFVFTRTAGGNDPAADSDPDAVTGRTAPIRLGDGESVRSVDVGITRRPASSEPASSSASSAHFAPRILPAPAPAQLATGGHTRSTLSIFVLVLAGLLALSILLGLARPRPVTVR